MSDHVHRFDPVSGWCISGCVGYREDDRLIHKGGAVFRPGHTYDQEEASHDDR